MPTSPSGLPSWRYVSDGVANGTHVNRTGPRARCTVKNCSTVSAAGRRVRQHLVGADLRFGLREPLGSEHHISVRVAHHQVGCDRPFLVERLQRGNWIGGRRHAGENALRFFTKIAVMMAIKRTCQPGVQKDREQAQRRGDDQHVPQSRACFKRPDHQRAPKSATRSRLRAPRESSATRRRPPVFDGDDSRRRQSRWSCDPT